MAPRIPKSVKKWSAKPFVLRSQLPNQTVQNTAPVPTGPLARAPRITPMGGQTQYGKKSPPAGFGSIGLTGES